MNHVRLPSAVEWSHHFLKQAVTPGDWVVDATAGNGHDTLFLARLVGDSGRVFAFDVQDQAVGAARERLQAAGVADWCDVHHAGHERMKELLPGEAGGRLAAVVFNLGYLPRSDDKSVMTLPETSLSAIDQARDLISAGGMLVVVTYPGHAGGDEEAAQVAAHLAALDHAEWNVQHIRCANRTSTRPPECWVAVKLANLH